jgi:hypothetical protein
MGVPDGSALMQARRGPEGVAALRAIAMSG